MSIVCIIASHLSSIQRFLWLNEAIISALEGLNADRIIVAYSGNIDIIRSSDPKVKYINSPVKKYQFDHIESCMQHIQPTDYVVFMDDDDMFLPTAGKLVREFISDSNNVSCLGCQITTLDNDNIHNAFNYKNIIDHYDDLMIGFNVSIGKGSFGKYNDLYRSYDTPDTICRGSELMIYFETRDVQWKIALQFEPYSKGEEDLVFGKYQEKLSGYKRVSEPYMFHRLHNLRRDY